MLGGIGGGGGREARLTVFCWIAGEEDSIIPPCLTLLLGLRPGEFVPVQADAACTINRGFVRLHDAAATGELPEPARDADAAAAGIALSAVAGTLAANYQTCHENAEQLRALQAWVSEMASTTK